MNINGIALTFHMSKTNDKKHSWDVKCWLLKTSLSAGPPFTIVYYVPRRIMRLIERRATMLAGDRSRGPISPGSIVASLVISRIVCIGTYSIFCDLGAYTSFYAYNSNPIWKGRNFRDYRPSHLTFREYFRPLWFSRSCVVVAYFNRRMRSSNVQGFVSTVPTLYENEEE